jgi:tetratricopeptide (TPR) repeat protein
VKRRQGKLHEALKLQEEAVVLDPRNSDMWVNLGRSVTAHRDYNRAREMYDRAIAIAPDEPDIVGEKAYTFVLEGNLDAAEAAVANLDANVLSAAFGTQINLAVLRRQYDRAIELLNRSLTAPETPRAVRASDRVDLGGLQLWTGRPEGRANVEQGRAELIAILNEGDTGPENAAARIIAAALLGDDAAVERESETLLRENQADHWALPRAQVACARAYAVLGDADHAIELLAAALAAPSDITPMPGLLRIDPVWDKIRHDPRFQKLCVDGKL